MIEHNKEILSIFDKFPALCSYVDKDGYYRFVNRQYEKWFGKPPEEVIGKHYSEILGKEAYEMIRNHIEDALKGQRVAYEMSVPYANGGPRWVSAEYVPDTDEEGNIKGFFALVVDITQRKTMEDTLRENEKNCRTLIENAVDGMLVAAMDGRFLTANPTMCRMLGYDLEELKGMSVPDIHPAEDVPYIIEQFEELARGDATENHNIPVKRKDGSVFYADISASHVTLSGEKCLLGIFRDVTERKQIEEALRESEFRFREVYENMADGVAIYEAVDDGADFVFKDMNRSGERIGEVRKRDIIGRRVTDVFPGVGAAEFGLLEVFRRVWRTGKSEHHREAIYKDDRHTLWVRNYVFKLPSGEIIAIYSDITERKKTEEELRQGSRRLRAMSLRMSELEEEERKKLARELHDKVGPNLSVLGINLSIIESQLSQECKEKVMSRLADSQELVKSIAAGIRDVMTDLRSELLDEYGLSSALRWYADIFAGRTTINTLVKGDDIMPRLPLNTETVLFRIIQEALTNIAKHAGASEAIIAIEDAAENVTITVSDNGKGLDIAAARQRSEKQGLGLASMEERLAAIGGSLKIESSPGRWTRVIIDVKRS
ncbi:MAG: PAS domain S-box protein [Nitrospirota bacterium]